MKSETFFTMRGGDKLTLKTARARAYNMETDPVVIFRDVKRVVGRKKVYIVTDRGLFETSDFNKWEAGNENNN